MHTRENHYRMDYAVDMVGFKQIGEDFLLKESAIIPLNEESDPLVYLFKNPFSWSELSKKLKKENIQLERECHGIAWDADGLEYSFIGSILHEVLQDAKRIFVFDEPKQKWLQ